MIVLRTPEEIAKMKKAGELVAACHREIAKRIRPGTTTWEIEEFVESFTKQKGAIPEQKGYFGYPYATCASVNDVICHGFPRKEPLQEGDLVTIDMVFSVDGWMADSAWSYPVGRVSEKVKKLLSTTEQALNLGIEKAVIGNRVGDVSNAIQTFAEAKGYSVVRQFIGHGIGREMHEELQVPHYGPAGKGPLLREGMVFTIEPMLNTGSYEAYIEEDGWTARTWDGGLSAQYEHTIAVTANGPLILTKQ